jgi:hypothetical protein
MVVAQFVAGVWLGSWFVAGNVLWSGGVIILSLQYYGWLVKDLWLPVSLQGVLRVVGLPQPSLPSPALQQAFDQLLLLPAPPMFILAGVILAAAAGFGKRTITRRAPQPPRVVSCAHRRALHDIGITSLHVHESPGKR